MRKFLMTASLVSAGLIALTSAQPAAVIVHDLTSLPFQTRGNIQIKAVVTDEGSIGVAIARGGVTQTGHHHQQEQVVLALDRPLGYTVAGTSHSVEKYSALIPPSNVHHFYATRDGEATTFIEYQPVARTDWAPPFTPYKPMLSPEPSPLAAGRAVTRELSPQSSGWTIAGAARTNEFAGEQLKIVMIELRNAGTSIEVPATATGRQFFFVLEGKPWLSAPGIQRQLVPQTIVEMSSGTRPIRFETPKDGPALIAVFSRLR